MNIIALEALTFGLGRLAEAARKYGCSLILFTRDKTVYGHELSLLDERHITVVELDTFDEHAVIEMIEKTKGVVALLSLTDTWSLHCVNISSALGLPVHNADAIRLARDKFRLRNCLYKAGLSSTQSQLVNPGELDKTSVTQDVSYPCIVKDTAGTGSQNIWIAYDEAGLLQTLDKAAQEVLRGQIAIESFLSGTLYSLETLSWKGETRVIALTSRIISPEPYFREEAFSSPVIVSHALNAELEIWIDNVLNSVGYNNGFAHTEFMMTGTRFEVIEINPRLGGVQIGEALCQSLGLNIYDAWVEMALNKRPALMDVPLNIHKGVGQLIIYATETGEFSHVEGLDRLNHHPGSPHFYPTAYRGKSISTLDDQRASIGILFAEGETSEVALLNAFAARNKLHVVMTGSA